MAQEAFFYLERLNPGTAPFNIAVRFRLDGPLDVPLLRRAFSAIVERHEVLRVQFEDEDGELVQIVLPSVDVPIAIVDLSAETPDARETRLIEIGLDEAREAFDLTRAPLMRGLLVRLGDTEHILHVTVHHAVADGWSIGILTDELATHYAALAGGGGPQPPPLPIQYADFAVWQREFLAGPEVTKQLDYWVHKLGGYVEVDLPTDHVRPAVKRWNGDIVSRLLPVELTSRLEVIAQRNGATLFQVFLSAFKILLHRYTGSEDITVGTPIAGRNRAELEPLIGTFINSLLLRTDLSGDPSFDVLLGRVRDTALDAIANQDLPFESLVRELKPARDPSRNPLFQINFTHQRDFVKPVEFAGVRLTAMPSVSPGAIFDLHFFMVERDGVWRASCDFSVDLFERDTALRLLGHFQTLLEAIADSPGSPISELPLLTGSERAQLAGWARRSTDYPRDANLGSLFAGVASRMPDRTALVCGGESITYRRLHANASFLAQSLRGAGVGPGTLVGIAASPSPELIVGLLAITLAGGAYVPIDPAYPEERLRHLLEHTHTSVVLADRGAAPSLPPGDYRLILLEEIGPDAEPARIDAEGLTAEHPAYVLYTSGSTGKPQGVVVPQRGVIRLVLGADYIHFGPDEVFLLAAPLSFDASTFEIWGTLLHGAKLVIPEPESSSLTGIGESVRKYGVTTLWLTAGLFQIMVDEHLDDLGGLRNLLAGGDVLPPAQVRRALDVLRGTRLVNGYGPTENTTFTTCHTITAADLDRHSIPIGRPIPNTSVWILDDRGRQVPIGVPGELFTGGDGLALGYLDDPARTAEKFVFRVIGDSGGERLFRTGDLARWLPDGTIEFLGRGDRQVKIRGCRVEPGEVEVVLADHPSVGACKVAAWGDGAGDKKLVAWVAPVAGGTIDRRGIMEFLTGKLPPFLCPDVIVVLDALPLTPNGKVDMAALPPPNFERVGERVSEPPATESERKIAAICGQLLGIPSMGRDDNFFDLGGHSLLALRLFSGIRRAFGISLPLASLLHAPTVRALAALLDEELENTGDGGDSLPESIIAPINGSGHLPPFFCVHGGDGGVIFYRNLSRYLSPDRPLLAIESPALRSGEEIRVESVESIAKGYLALIRGRQKRGPYFLGGYSFGGLVAYEMARQLVGAGETVALLALFDTPNPAEPGRPYTFSERLVRAWNRHPEKGIFGRLVSIGIRLLLGRASSTWVNRAPAKPRDARIARLCEAHLESLEAYRPGPYPGSLTLFKASIPDEILKLPDDYGWGSIVGSIEVIDVPGRHLDLFEPGNAERFGVELARVIDRAGS